MSNTIHMQSYNAVADLTMPEGGSQVDSVEVLEERFRKSKQLHLCLCAIGEMGHYIPIVRLASALELAGHKVTILGQHFAAEKCRKFCELNDIKGEVLFPDEPLGYDRDQYFIGKEKDKSQQLFLPLGPEQEVVDCYVQAMKSCQPDMVIAEAVSHFGFKAADQLQIPTMCHLSLSLDNLDMSMLAYTPLEGRVWGSPCGCVCLCPTMYDIFNDLFFRYSATPEFKRIAVSCAERVTISTTFFGFEKPTYVPPNVVLTGPLIDQD